MRTAAALGRHAGQGPQPLESLGASRAVRPRHVPLDQWPGDPRHAVPEVLYDENGTELPRYRATEACYSSVDVDGGRLVEADFELYHLGPPAHYLDPVNQAAIDQTLAHPPGEFLDPVEQLPLTMGAAVA